MPYQCEKCSKIFTSFSNLEKHKNRQKPCIIENDVDLYCKCEFCERLFSTDYNLRRHFDICKVRNDISKLRQYYMKVMAQNDSLNKQKDRLIKQKEISIKHKDELIQQLKSNDIDKNQTISLVDNDLESIDSEEVSEYEDSSDSEDTEIVESKIYSSSDLHNKNYIYIIQEREFIKTKEPIYKIGRTKHGYIKRLKNYPKNSVVLCILKVPDSLSYERSLIKEFDKKFIKRTDIGNEYYEGDPAKLIKAFCKITSKLNMSR